MKLNFCAACGVWQGKLRQCSPPSPTNCENAREYREMLQRELNEMRHLIKRA